MEDKGIKGFLFQFNKNNIVFLLFFLFKKEKNANLTTGDILELYQLE